jgi:transposase-like protein
MGAKISHEAREALRLIREGATVQEAAKQAGVHPSTVWRWIKLEGIDYQRKKQDNPPI